MMEASGNPPPPAEPPQASPTPPPPPPPPPADDESVHTGWRILAVILALALAFAAAVMVVAMLDIGDTPLRDECVKQNVAAPGSCAEYFDGSSTQKAISLVLGWPSGVLAGLAALVALAFAFTGRRGRLVIQLTAAAIVLGAASIIVGSL